MSGKSGEGGGLGGALCPGIQDWRLRLGCSMNAKWVESLKILTIHVRYVSINIQSCAWTQIAWVCFVQKGSLVSLHSIL